MGGSTNVQVVGLAAGLATVLMWLLGFFYPELMSQAPTGLEAAITGIFAVLMGLIFNHNAGFDVLPGKGDR
ncbi:hypothetical protein LCGC14_2886500 [marine sediment metagenome]|uniref:Uncharacterized protein n=1 Tax=marine sediment metagenome TaxID=412755 RepID=A0A0F8XYJ3_9ZZZZ